ncbi:MAG: hypothetical protein IJO50_05110 [Clostridia bacterium]|nr:hypothetical protein [Clostridia bacterium]
MKKQLDLLDTLKLFFAHWKAILISAMISALLFFSYSSFLMAPTYVSKGSLYVNSTPRVTNYVNLTDMATSLQLALTYVELLHSETFCTTIREDANLPYTNRQIKGMYNIEIQNDSQIMTVQAVGRSPEEASGLVGSILNNAQGEIDRVVKGGVVSVVDEASVPTGPSSPNVPRNTILGFMFGALVCAGVIFLIHLLDKRVKNESDLMSVRELHLLGVIPDADMLR